jgi:ABC-type microcin C transport system permease subunit YejB
MDRTLEPETLQKMIKLYGAQHSVDIYNEFVQNYRKKHLGEILYNNDHTVVNDWYQKRGQIFARFAERYYIRGK